MTPVPRPARPLNEQLETVMRRKRVSQRELSRRLANLDGSKPESKRRWLVKVLNGDVEPGEESAAELEQALALNGGYFKLSGPAAPRSRKDRLQALEATVAALERELDASKQAHRLLLRRVQALEQEQAGRKQSQRVARSSRRGDG